MRIPTFTAVLRASAVLLLMTSPRLALAQPAASVQPTAPPAAQGRPTIATLATGDRLSGLLAPSGAAGLSLQTPAFGPLTLPWASLATVEFGVPVRVRLVDGTTLSGTAAWQGGAVVVRDANGSESTAPPARIALLQWNDQPPLTWRDRWNIVGTASTQAARGNTETTALNAGGSATYRGAQTGVGLYGNRSYSSAGRPGAAETTGDTAATGGRLDRYLIDDGFVFGSTDFKYDRFQQVQRVWTTVGAGFDVISTTRLALTMSTGLARGRDGVKSLIKSGVLAGNEVELSRAYNQLQIGEGLRWKGRRRGSVLSQDLTFYRQVGNASVSAAAGGRSGVTLRIPESGYMRLDSSTRFQAPLTDRLSLQGAMQTSHTNHPYPGSKKNDLLVSLGLTVQIGKQSLGAYDGSSSNVGTLAGSGTMERAQEQR